MKTKTILLGAVAALLLFPAAGHAAERVKAKVDCAPAGKRLVYDCTIMLTGKKSGTPVAGAKVVIGADMPAMAMAHNVRPVNAMAMGKPGMYHAKLQLEMYGEWALKMDVTGPTRDRIIHKMHFGAPEGEKAGMKHGSGEMKHGSGGMKHDSGGMKMKKDN